MARPPWNVDYDEPSNRAISIDTNGKPWDFESALKAANAKPVSGTLSGAWDEDARLIFPEAINPPQRVIILPHGYRWFSVYYAAADVVMTQPDFGSITLNGGQWNRKIMWPHRAVRGWWSTSTMRDWCMALCWFGVALGAATWVKHMVSPWPPAFFIFWIAVSILMILAGMWGAGRRDH